MATLPAPAVTRAGWKALAERLCGSPEEDFIFVKINPPGSYQQGLPKNPCRLEPCNHCRRHRGRLLGRGGNRRVKTILQDTDAVSATATAVGTGGKWPGDNGHLPPVIVRPHFVSTPDTRKIKWAPPAPFPPPGMAAIRNGDFVRALKT